MILLFETVNSQQGFNFKIVKRVMTEGYMLLRLYFLFFFFPARVLPGVPHQGPVRRVRPLHMQAQSGVRYHDVRGGSIDPEPHSQIRGKRSTGILVLRKTDVIRIGIGPTIKGQKEKETVKTDRAREGVDYSPVRGRALACYN